MRAERETLDNGKIVERLYRDSWKERFRVEISWQYIEDFRAREPGYWLVYDRVDRASSVMWIWYLAPLAKIGNWIRKTYLFTIPNWLYRHGHFRYEPGEAIPIFWLPRISFKKLKIKR